MGFGRRAFYFGAKKGRKRKHEKSEIFLTVAIVTHILIVLFNIMKPKVKNGFIKENEKTFYYVNNVKTFGWQEVNGNYYFFNEDWIMQTGWVEQNGFWYYLNSNGKMLNDGMYKLNDNNYYCFDSDGKMMHDTQTTIKGKEVLIDSNGIAKELPDHKIVFNCTFPKTFRHDSRYLWSDVTIENIRYEVKNNSFTTYWSGFAGNTYEGPNYSKGRAVGYKLYDPEGYVIDSGSFYTGVALRMGEKFKDKEEYIGRGKVKTKGIYRLELMNLN